jgi:hypothetical protein
VAWQTAVHVALEELDKGVFLGQLVAQLGDGVDKKLFRRISGHVAGVDAAARKAAARRFTVLSLPEGRGREERGRIACISWPHECSSSEPLGRARFREGRRVRIFTLRRFGANRPEAGKPGEVSGRSRFDSKARRMRTLDRSRDSLRLFRKHRPQVR